MDMILLAAGNSSRFGENKLLYPVGGRPMFLHAVELARALAEEGRIRRIVLVTQYTALADELRKAGIAATAGEAPAGEEKQGGPEIELVYNDRPDQGISLSLRLGLAHLLDAKPASGGGAEQAAPSACLFAVCDQPYLRHATVAALIDRFAASGLGMAACASGEKIGNPVIFSEKYYPELLALTGDRGGKRVLLRHPEDVALLETDPRELEDLDYRPKSPADKPAGELFPFLADGRRHVVSIVGAGGKTTTMNYLVSEAARRGLRAVATTTTHILRPDGPDYLPEEELPEALEARWAAGKAGTVGRLAGNNGPQKLQSLPGPLLDEVIARADLAVIEADGAKCLPLKAPAAHEPVIHPATDVVIAVLGLRAAGRPLGEVSARVDEVWGVLREARAAEGAAEEAGEDPAGHLVGAEDLAALFLSERGLRKDVGARSYFCILNQCDDEERLALARRVAEQMPGECVIASRHAGGKHDFWKL